MLRKLKQIIALWDALEEPPVGWKYSILTLTFYAALWVFNGDDRGEYYVLKFHSSEEEKAFFIFLKKAFDCVPQELKKELAIFVQTCWIFH